MHLQLALTERRKTFIDTAAALVVASAAEEAKPEAAEANGNENGSPTAASADVAMAPTGLLIAGRDELPEDPDAEFVQTTAEVIAAAAGCVSACTLI